MASKGEGVGVHLENGLGLGIIIWGLCATYIFYLCGVIIYNVYFHPLAKFPGPFLYSALYLPYWRHVMIGDLTMKVKSFHEKYGDTVRVTPNQLSFNGTQAWRDIYGNRSGKRQLQRDPGFYIKDSSGVPNIINADDESHGRIRKLLSHAFSEKAMREEEPLITKYFDLLIRKLHEQVEGSAKGKVDIVNWYNFTTFDIIGDLSFGVPFGSLESGVLHFWIGNIFKGVKVGRIIRLGIAYPWLGNLLAFLMKQFPQVAEARAKHEEFSHGSVEKRLAMETDRKDFMAYVLRNNDKNGMTEAEIKETFSIILIAGSEPVASVLSGATYYLLRNQDALHKVTHEIRNAFQSENDINFTSVSQLRYLHAVIEESLRMYPPVPGTLLRLTPLEGDMINGHAIPGNTSVGVNQYSTYRAPQNFRDPSKFAPERWLDNDAYYATDQKSARQSFSLGPRNCIGQTLAYAEMRSVLARVFWNFDMLLCDESVDWPRQKDFVMWDKPELMVQLTPRNFG